MRISDWSSDVCSSDLVELGIEPRMTLVQMQSAAAVATTDAASAAAGVSRGKAAVTEARSALTQVHEDWRSQAAADLASAQAELSAARKSVVLGKSGSVR